MATKRTKKSPLPEPVRIDSRICFAIAYFSSEEDAEKYAAKVRKDGTTYNGGYFHGVPCGREKSRDYTKDGIKYYAVTF